MKKIQEIIVVEGKSDQAFLSSFLDADILTCNGSAIDGFDLDYLKRISETRGVIIFTDPDYPGEKIRKTISAVIPNCKHAFVNKKDAIKKNKVGVAETSKEKILEALENMVTLSTDINGSLTQSDLYDLGLLGIEQAGINRTKICQNYHIGFCNGKTLLKRLNMLNISKEELKKVYDK